MGALSIKEQFGQRNADRTHERGVIESDRSHGLGQFNARTSRMNAEKKAPGFGLTVGPDGTIQFTQGIGPGELTSKTKGGLEDEAIESIKGLDRLKAAGETFDREFLTLGGKVSAAITAGKEKLGFETSDADREKLTRYTEFKRAALANLNEYINRITGAAVGADEAPRLIAAMPSAGQGLFDGDSPTEFKAKYNAVVKDLERAAARSIYARRNGISYESIPLARMDSIMKDRAAQLRDLVKAEDPTRSKEEIDAEARRRFRAEFGG